MKERVNKKLDEMMETLIEHGSFQTKMDLARNCPNKYLHDIYECTSNKKILKEVIKRADKSLLFEILNIETEPEVLSYVAERGYGLAPLSNHRSPVVREGVARGITKDTGLERMILKSLLYDTSPKVRAAALEKSFALFGKKISEFKADESPEIKRVLSENKIYKIS